MSPRHRMSFSHRALRALARPSALALLVLGILSSAAPTTATAAASATAAAAAASAASTTATPAAAASAASTAGRGPARSGRSETAPAARSDTTYRWGAFYTPNGSYPHEDDVPHAVSNAADITAIAAGNASDMALDSQGNVWTWGDGENYDLGNGSTANHSSRAIKVGGLPPIVAIGEADNTDVAVDAGGKVWGWGWNEGGQLCTGDSKRKNPIELTALFGVAAAAGGGTHMTYLLTNGTVEACGLNDDGQLGDGSTSDSTTPVTVTGLPSSPVAAISDGPSTSTALLDNGQVWDWGNNQYGQLGNGTTTNADLPVLVALPSAATQVCAGGDNQQNGQALALLSNGQVWGWGNDKLGQLGNGSTGASDDTPVEATALPSGVRFTAVVTGGFHSLALDSAGDLYGWGGDNQGQIGNGEGGQEDVLTPVRVLRRVGLVSATANDSLAQSGN